MCFVSYRITIKNLKKPHWRNPSKNQVGWLKPDLQTRLQNWSTKTELWFGN